MGILCRQGVLYWWGCSTYQGGSCEDGGPVTGGIASTLTGTVVCTTCGPIPDSDAHGMSFTTEAHPSGQFTHWRLRLGDTYYAIPWQLVQPYPPCPRCTMGELHVEDPHIAGMVVH